MTASEPQRVEVLHGVNLNLLGERDPLHYGTLTLADLEAQIAVWAAEAGLDASFFQTNAESAYVERLHALRGQVAAVILNPGSWTHYAYAIHDALELTGLPAVEVHLSDVQSREPWRALSVIGDLCLATYSGKGPEGYRLALQRLRQTLDEAGP
ncbi:MAG TPA: type II 3-dehydroquinate dehydratase [Solirubrobacteraceae bacterium]|jgi:3-dehydroquinate dehydratase-2|nr:type II 3-dehydroquinate dehydratase [Solirubrobacteraceae bacterium]